MKFHTVPVYSKLNNKSKLYEIYIHLHVVTRTSITSVQTAYKLFKDF